MNRESVSVADTSPNVPKSPKLSTFAHKTGFSLLQSCSLGNDELLELTMGGSAFQKLPAQQVTISGVHRPLQAVYSHAGPRRCRCRLVPTSAKDEKRSVVWYQKGGFMEQTETTVDADDYAVGFA